MTTQYTQKIYSTSNTNRASKYFVDDYRPQSQSQAQPTTTQMQDKKSDLEVRKNRFSRPSQTERSLHEEEARRGTGAPIPPPPSPQQLEDLSQDQVLSVGDLAATVPVTLPAPEERRYLRRTKRVEDLGCLFPANLNRSLAPLDYTAIGKYRSRSPSPDSDDSGITIRPRIRGIDNVGKGCHEWQA